MSSSEYPVRDLLERAERAVAESHRLVAAGVAFPSEDKPSPRGLRETEISVRNVMPGESTIDLDLHARAIAVAAVCARRRAHARNGKRGG